MAIGRDLLPSRRGGGLVIDVLNERRERVLTVNVDLHIARHTVQTWRRRESLAAPVIPDCAVKRFPNDLRCCALIAREIDISMSADLSEASMMYRRRASDDQKFHG